MADRLTEMRAVADMPGTSMRIASEDLRAIVARIDAQAAEIERMKATAARADTQAAVLRTVERWANHHARKPNTTAQEALSVIQHHPAIRAITASYADGVVPDTFDPYAEIERLRARLAEIEAQEPVALVETSGDQGAGIGWSGATQPVGAKLYARPVPAQAVPDGWRLVPVNLTQEMRHAWDEAPANSDDDDVNMNVAYGAMIAAVPERKARGCWCRLTLQLSGCRRQSA